MIDAQYDFQFQQEKFHWWYVCRRELVSNLLKKYHIKSDENILDIGCGTGHLISDLQRSHQIIGLDFSERAVNYCIERGLKNVKQGSILELPFPENHFDLVISLDVLEHIEEDSLALDEIYRVLKPGGKCIVFVPAFMFLWGKSDNISHHFRRYTKYSLLNLFKNKPFKVLECSFFNSFLFLPILLVRLFFRVIPNNSKVENEMSDGLLNKILYLIFSTELKLRNYFNFPFGVSLMIISQKKVGNHEA